MIGYNRLGINGRLANQMFQYASLRGIAAKHGYEWTIPPEDRETHNMADYNIMDGFKLPHLKNKGFVTADWPVHDEPCHDFDPEFFENCPDNINLEGFRQSEKYFKHIEDEVRNEFKFLDHIVEDCKGAVEIFDNPVALHIRRGDFLINSVHHHNLSMKYYEEALKQFDSDRQVIIFSDDTDWCKSQPLFEDDRFLVCEGGGPYTDLYMMSKCDDFIIANSTFSWWGAWLSNSEHVIAPKLWFGPDGQDPKDIYVDRWRYLDV